MYTYLHAYITRFISKKFLFIEIARKIEKNFFFGSIKERKYLAELFMIFKVRDLYFIHRRTHRQENPRSPRRETSP